MNRDDVLEELHKLHHTMTTGFSLLGARIEQVARKVGVDEAELATLRDEVRPLVVARHRMRKLAGVALLACASVIGGGVAALALQRLGLGSAHVELSPPEIAHP